MRFEHQYDENSPKITMELSNDAGLMEIINALKKFFIACEFSEQTINKYLPDPEDTDD